MITITLGAHRGKDQLNLLALPPKKRKRLGGNEPPTR